MFLTPENSAHSVVKKKYRERVKHKKKANLTFLAWGMKCYS